MLGWVEVSMLQQEFLVLYKAMGKSRKWYYANPKYSHSVKQRNKVWFECLNNIRCVDSGIPKSMPVLIGWSMPYMQITDISSQSYHCSQFYSISY